VTQVTLLATRPCDTAKIMNEPVGEHNVRADDYLIVTQDEVLCANLHSSLAVCCYDAVEETGALLHMRLAIPGGARDPNLTDATLSNDLAMLDRLLRSLTAACPRAQHWQVKLLAQIEEAPTARERFEGLLAFLGAVLQDAGIAIVSTEVRTEPTVQVRFRPTMGQVRTLTTATALNAR
jgi:chemotaxis receptor (MCP) glutamine deamidase CheD